MNKLSRYLTLTCLIFASYASTGIVLADASSMPAFVKEAAGKAKECKRAAHDNRKAGQQDTQRIDECALACRQVYSLYQQQQDQNSQLAQMERCMQLYNAYKTPDNSPVAEAEAPEITRVPSTIDEMVSRMTAMKSEKRQKRYPCAEGLRAISRQQLDIEQATPYWERCVNRYITRMEMDMKAKRLYGR